MDWLFNEDILKLFRSMNLQEKEKLLSAMNEKEAHLQKEREVKEALAKKIAAMESKLLCGGKNIIDHTNEQQRALEQRRKEIAEQKVHVILCIATEVDFIRKKQAKSLMSQ